MPGSVVSIGLARLRTIFCVTLRSNEESSSNENSAPNIALMSVNTATMMMPSKILKSTVGKTTFSSNATNKPVNTNVAIGYTSVGSHDKKLINTYHAIACASESTMTIISAFTKASRSVNAQSSSITANACSSSTLTSCTIRPRGKDIVYSLKNSAPARASIISNQRATAPRAKRVRANCLCAKFNHSANPTRTRTASHFRISSAACDADKSCAPYVVST